MIGQNGRLKVQTHFIPFDRLLWTYHQHGRFTDAYLKTFLDRLVILLQSHKLEIAYRNHILEQYHQQL